MGSAKFYDNPSKGGAHNLRKTDFFSQLCTYPCSSEGFDFWANFHTPKKYSFDPQNTPLHSGPLNLGHPV